MLLLKSLSLDKMVIEATKPSGSEKVMRCSEIWRSCQHKPGTGHFPCGKTYGNRESCGSGQRQDSPAWLRNRSNFLVLLRISDWIMGTCFAYKPSPRAMCPTCLCSGTGAWAADFWVPQDMWGSTWWQHSGWLRDVHMSACCCGADVAWLVCVLPAASIMGIMAFPRDAVGTQPSTPGRREIMRF